MDDNWIVENLENALATWNEKLAEIWQLVSMTPQEFKGGGIWNIVVQINGALQAIGYGLLVLFFAMGLFKNTVNFQELRRPEAALRYFLHFVAAKAAVTYCMPLMLAVFDICGGIVSVAAGLFCRKMDGRFCRKKPDTDVRRAGRIDVAGVFCRTREGRGQSRSLH